MRFYNRQHASRPRFTVRGTAGTLRRLLGRSGRAAAQPGLGGLESLESRLHLAAVAWDGGAGTDSWHDALNWSNDAVPTIVDDVTIANTALAEVRISTGGAAARSLTTDENLRVRSNQSLTLTQGAVVNGVLSLGIGAENGSILFQTTAAQALAGTGQVVFDSTNATFNNSVIASTGVTLTIGPGITIRGGNGSLQGVGTGATLINQGTIAADVSGRTIEISPHSSSTFTNSGALSASNAGTLRLNGAIDFGPGGGFNSIGGTVRLTGSLGNTGDTLTINATTGPLEISGGTITGGTINLNDGVGLTFVASTTATLTNVQVTGNLVVNSAASNLGLHLLGTTRFTLLTITASGVVVFFPGNGTIFDEIVVNTAVGAAGGATLRPTAASSSLTLAAGGIIRVNATSTRGVSIGVNNTQPFFNDGTVQLLAPVGNGATAPVTNNGTLELGAGSFNFVRELAGFGIFTIAGTATVSVSSTYNGTVNLQPGGNLGGAGNFSLVGVLNWTGGSMTGSGITALAAAADLFISGSSPKTLSRTFTTAADGLWTAGSLAMASGTFVNEANTTLTVASNAAITALSGANQFINDGTIVLESGSGFDFGGGVAYSTGPGSSTVIDGEFIVDEDSTFDGGIILSPTGSISGPGDVIFNGLFVWQGGTLAGPGTVTVSVLGLLAIEGPANKSLNTVMDHFAVGGSWTGGCLLMSNGTFTNRAGATLDVFADPLLDVMGVAGSNTFNNAGLITVHTGELIIGVPGTNSGTIIVIPPDTLVFTDSWTYTPASSLEGPGGVNFAGGTHVFPTGTFSITGPITLSGGGLSLHASDLPYYDAATFTFSGVSWVIGPGQTFTLSGGEIRTIAANASITLGAGAGAPALAALANIDGALILDGAALAVTPHDGTLTSRGTLTLGAGSLLNVTGSITLEAGNALTMQIGGTTPALQARIVSSVAAAIGGSLDARWAAGYTPVGMFDARLIAAPTLAGSWTSSTIAAPASGAYRTSLLTDAQGLRFVHTRTADWNNDLAVNVPDLFAFLSSWFAGQGDFDNSGVNAVPDIFAFLSAWFAA